MLRRVERTQTITIEAPVREAPPPAVIPSIFARTRAEGHVLGPIQRDVTPLPLHEEELVRNRLAAVKIRELISSLLSAPLSRERRAELERWIETFDSAEGEARVFSLATLYLNLIRKEFRTTPILTLCEAILKLLLGENTNAYLNNCQKVNNFQKKCVLIETRYREHQERFREEEQRVNTLIDQTTDTMREEILRVNGQAAVVIDQIEEETERLAEETEAANREFQVRQQEIRGMGNSVPKLMQAAGKANEQVRRFK